MFGYGPNVPVNQPLPCAGYGNMMLQMADASVIVPRAANGHTSTPHVEGFHEVYHHLLCQRLLELVRES